ncbi:hypothetical protein B0J15DRAFT_472132 [Fusarium solani]|uniref:Uncharacterized protein n=1 Tax=Fusarium solani TaxID=169388 RepID=A0A9P9G4V0_FUSSL|nr:uncharacterized protein B0J15DRAFT_472132 [Fusarium solani]KAH7232608.1 hypothetical protein B0J15DRAFT_472132 [Fusarium solani]
MSAKIRLRCRVHQLLYELFSRLKTPRGSDRPHAIAEVERLLGKETGDRALHGLFSGEMARGLLWKRAHDEASLTPIDDVKLAPTWSWMAYGGAISYFNVPTDEHEVCWAEMAFDEGHYRTDLSIRIHGHLVERSETIKAAYDAPNEIDIQGKGREERRIVVATYEPEDGDYVTGYILIGKLIGNDRHVECWRRIGVGELERPKGMKAERESTFIVLE